MGFCALAISTYSSIQEFRGGFGERGDGVKEMTVEKVLRVIRRDKSEKKGSCNMGLVNGQEGG